ncbi:MAG TPA: tachylectin-related carbohydrate-binding protein, partial [Pseudonocardiaceae bacterium]|nr:tachylectin-related carbohydrate-binding protein [Pseudonocardiaceae bacterium]
MAARLAVATLLGAAVPLILPGAGQAAAATVTCTSNTHVFDVRGNGDLWLYDHTAPTTGAFTWANVHMIGAGFTGTILGGAGGDIYRITADGTLRLYNFSNGGWTNAGGTAIGSGFQMFAPNMITSDSAGRIYAANQFGELFMYHYDKATRTWDDGAGTPMDLGWNFFAQNGYVQITAAGDGVVYAVDKAGALFRYRYDPHSQRWTEYGRRVGAGFDGPIFSPGGDVLYLRNLNAGTINWYHFNDDTGTWDNGGGGRLVGAGFDWSNHPYVTSGTDTCAGPTPAPVAAVTPVPAPADAPIAMTSDLDGVTHMFYPDQAGHVVEAIPANGTSVLTRQFDTIVTTAPISAANAAVAVLDSAGQVWINR